MIFSRSWALYAPNNPSATSIRPSRCKPRVIIANVAVNNAAVMVDGNTYEQACSMINSKVPIAKPING